MIKVEGYKAFRGTMIITPKNEKFPPFEMSCDWLYKPEFDCWYGGGSSFCSDICQIKEDETK